MAGIARILAEDPNASYENNLIPSSISNNGITDIKLNHDSSIRFLIISYLRIENN